MSNDQFDSGEFDEWIGSSELSLDHFLCSSSNLNQESLADVGLDREDDYWTSTLDSYIDTSLMSLISNDNHLNDQYSDIIVEYFSNLTNELTVLMFHPTVVQKSYQNEKR